MYVAVDKDNNRVYIDEANKDDELFCPICGEAVIVKKGDINAHHFAHKSLNECDHWSYDMSDWHREWQERFPEECREVVVEYAGKKHRADVLVNNTVIEFQHSPISEEEFDERNSFYTKAGYNVVWVFDVIDEWESGRMSFSENKNGVVCWAYPKKTLLYFEPHKQNKISVYLQTDYQNDDSVYGIIRMTWKPRDNINYFCYKSSESYNLETFMQLFFPEKYEEEDLSFSDLYDVKYQSRMHLNYGCYHDCPLDEVKDHMKCGFYCKYGWGMVDPCEPNEDLYPVGCQYRFKNIEIKEGSKIVDLVRNRDGFIVQIITEDEDGDTQIIECPNPPKTTVYTLSEIWDKIQPKIMICCNIRTGDKVKISRDPKIHMLKYKKIYGRFQKSDWEDFSSKSMEIYNANRKEWLCTWYCD